MGSLRAKSRLRSGPVHLVPETQADAGVQVAFGDVGGRAGTQRELVQQAEEIPAEQTHVRAERAVYAVADAGEATRLEIRAGAHLHPVRDRLAFDTQTKPERRVLAGGLALL